MYRCRSCCCRCCCCCWSRSVSDWSVNLSIRPINHCRCDSALMPAYSCTKAWGFSDVWSSANSSAHCCCGSSLDFCSALISAAPMTPSWNKKLWCLRGWCYWWPSSEVSWTWASTPRSTLRNLMLSNKIMSENSTFTTLHHVNTDRIAWN